MIGVLTISVNYRVSINDCRAQPALEKNITVPPF
jgi:hypothetical protein